MALPSLESVGFAQINSASASKRLVCIGNSFGFHAPNFFPKDGGKFTSIPPALLPLKDHLKNCTLFSNLDHGVKGGHFAVHSFLSGVKQSQAASMPNGNLSLDQRAAEVLGSQTRFPSLVIGSENGLHGGCQMSWTRSGVRVPPIEGPRELFRKLYLQDDQKNQKIFRQKFDLKKSILDATLEDAKSLSKGLTGRDRDKLDEYFTSIREVERKIHQREKWQSIEKPKPATDEPVNKNLVEDIPVLYQLIGLALETDSTRIASFEMAGAQFKTGLLGLKNGYHAYSHHGKKQENIDALLTLEQYQTKCFAKFLDQMANTKSVEGIHSSMKQPFSLAVEWGMGTPIPIRTCLSLWREIGTEPESTRYFQGAKANGSPSPIFIFPSCKIWE
jgi:hypothetical protein